MSDTEYVDAVIIHKGAKVEVQIGLLDCFSQNYAAKFFEDGTCLGSVLLLAPVFESPMELVAIALEAKLSLDRKPKTPRRHRLIDLVPELSILGGFLVSILYLITHRH